MTYKIEWTFVRDGKSFRPDSQAIVPLKKCNDLSHYRIDDVTTIPPSVYQRIAALYPLEVEVYKMNDNVYVARHDGARTSRRHLARYWD